MTLINTLAQMLTMEKEVSFNAEPILLLIVALDLNILSNWFVLTIYIDIINLSKYPPEMLYIKQIHFFCSKIVTPKWKLIIKCRISWNTDWGILIKHKHCQKAKCVNNSYWRKCNSSNLLEIADNEILLLEF